MIKHICLIIPVLKPYNFSIYITLTEMKQSQITGTELVEMSRTNICIMKTA